MNSCDVFEQMQNMSSMYLASNKKLHCNINYEIDIRDIRLFEVTNQTYDTISKNLYAIENILDAMQSQDVTYVYLIQGTGKGIHYYYGVVPLLNSNKHMDDKLIEMKKCEELFIANFEVNYPGSSIAELSDKEKQMLQRELLREEACATLEGVPGVISSSSTTLGMDRFVNIMEQESFFAMVLAQPLSENKINEIVCEQQAVLDQLAPILDFSKIKQQSNVNEVSAFLDRNQVNTTTQTNTSSEQLLFQLFSTSGSLPLKLGRGSLQQLEDVFFNNGVSNNELIELMDNLCLQQQREHIQKNNRVHSDTNKEKGKERLEGIVNVSKATLPEENKPVVTTNKMEGQGIRKSMRSDRRNPLGVPLIKRNNKNNSQSNNSPHNTFTCPETEYKITEENVIDVGDEILRYLVKPYHALDVMKENRDMLRIQETIQAEENLLFDGVDEIAAELLERKSDFTLASINRQDSRVNARVKSCSTNNRLAVSNRDACSNICSVTERYTNQAVNSWNRYLIDIVNSRLLYGENRGIYVYSTTVFAGNDSKLNKVIAAWRGMNEYEMVSKVPITKTILYKDMNQYNNIVNFQIPKYFYCNNNKSLPISYQEVLARSACSQFIEGDYLYGGNWVSSKELRYMFALPLMSTIKTHVNRSKEDRKVELSITSLDKSTFPHLDRKKLKNGSIIVGERHCRKEETLKNILIKFDRPFTLLEFNTGRYSKMFKGEQRIERYPVLTNAGKVLKLNPFELFPDELIDNHVELLLAILIHCYGFDPMLTDMVKNAIYELYVSFGWNLYTNTNDMYKKLAYTKEVKAFPTFSDLLYKAEEIIRKQIRDKDLQLKYLSRVRGALNGWIIGKKSTLLDAEHSMNLTAFMEQNMSIELEELVNEADRKFFSLLYMWRCMAIKKSQGRMDNNCNHVIVVEDMGRILGKGSSISTQWEENAVETIAEYLVSSMKYGESFVLIEEGVSSLPKNIKSELYTVFIHQISNIQEKRDLVQWMNIKKQYIDVLTNFKSNEFLCIMRDSQEIYECRL